LTGLDKSKAIYLYPNKQSVVIQNYVKQFEDPKCYIIPASQRAATVTLAIGSAAAPGVAFPDELLDSARINQ